VDDAALGATLAQDTDLPARAGGPVQGAADLPLVEAAHYEIISEHARGGLGRIIRARDRRTGRLVAIKEMLGDDDGAARRFAQEAMITANLQHPAIVPVYELGRWASGAPFYAMKLVAGGSFEQVIRESTGPSLADRLARLSVIVSVADALAYAHANGVIHRDLKPANVLVGEYGETVVIDWGLAKIVGAADPAVAAVTLEPARAPLVLPTASSGGGETVAGSVMGTPFYMPPEQAVGDAVDQRADVYAIGAMLYFLISGAAPFADRKPRDTAAVLALAAGDTPTPLATLQPSAPRDLVAIATKAMARDPGDRYRSAAELADDLRRFTTGQLVSAHRYELRTLVVRWLRKYRAAVTVAAVLLAVLIGGGVYSVRRILAGERTARAEAAATQENLATALMQKGRVAEDAQQWARAAMYYAASGVRHDTPEARWAAGFAEARAMVPQARHLGHHGLVHALAIAPDGERVASVDASGDLQLWSPHDGALIAHRQLASTSLFAVAFSPDGRELAVAGEDGVISRLAANDLTTQSELRGHVGRVWGLAYSPNGTLLASAGEDMTARLWPLAGGAARELRGHTQRVYSVAFSADGKRLVTGSDDRSAWLWDVATGVGSRVGAHNAGGVRVALFLHDGTDIVTAGWDSTIRVWRPPAVEPVHEWPLLWGSPGAALSPDGDVLVTGGSAIRARRTSTYEVMTLLDGGTGATQALAFSRDGRWLVTGDDSGVAIVWDARALHRIVASGHQDSVTSLAFTPSGAKLVTASDGDHTVRIWDVASGGELSRITTTGTCGTGVLALGEDEVAAACEDGTVRRWDGSGRELARLTSDVWLRETALSPDGKTIAAGHIDGRVALIDVASWTITDERTLHHHQVQHLQLTADGHLVSSALDGHVAMWRVPGLTPELDLDLRKHEGSVWAQLSPDGAQLAESNDDGTIGIWDVAKHAWFGGPGGEVVAKIGFGPYVYFAPDSKRAYTVSGDGVVRVYDTATWHEPETLDSHEGVSSQLALSRDGKTMAVGYIDGAVIIWDLVTRKIRMRVGGGTRDHGSCADLATAAWIDSGQRELVDAACQVAPAAYADGLAARSQQRLDVDDLTARWSWEPTPGPARAQP
jgi:WD40 repeat protein/tRNA A-37 threonylcarbamoyl transferase component Bud32